MISYRIIKFPATIQHITMTLDINNRLPAIYMRFGTSDTNEAKRFTHVDSCTGMNVGNPKLNQ